jgi:hypothetical protein
MALFPASPSVNDTYTLGSKTWLYDGAGWQVYSTTNSISVGANVTVNTSSYFVGNSTVNTIITQNSLVLGGAVTANGSTGTAGYLLTSSGSSNVYWAAAPSSVAGSNTQIQYNNSGSLAASAALTFNNTTNSISVSNSATISGALGVGTAPSTTAGEIRATNNITAYYSDGRLKNISYTIPNALFKVNILKGVLYKNNNLAAEYGYTDQSEQVGVIAQDVELVLPQIVKPAPFDIVKNDEGVEVSKSGQNYKTVQYEKLVPLLIEAIKELSQKVDNLEKRISNR